MIVEAQYEGEKGKSCMDFVLYRVTKSSVNTGGTREQESETGTKTYKERLYKNE